MLKDLSRTAVDGYLKVVRRPIDAVVARTGNDAMATKVDRADAKARGLAGNVLRDESLRKDAARRFEAASERQDAVQLREIAERRRTQAEADAKRAEAQAETRRKQAAKQAASSKKQADQRERAKKSADAKRAEARKASAAKSATAKKAEVAKKAKAKKVEQLEKKQEALDIKAEAVAVAAESKRLKDAAGEAKAARKNGS